MKYKIGTNQFRKKQRIVDTWEFTLLAGFTVIAIIAMIGYFIRQEGIRHAYAEMPIVSPLANPTPTPTKVISEKKPTQEEIEGYIKTIFGKDAKLAIAVSKNECNPANKKYPYCVFHTPHEYSVGVFQINLFNKSHWIHAQKVPGETMEEKIEWLKNPYHNTLIAYKIFKDQDGFQAWTGYTSGNYLKDM